MLVTKRDKTTQTLEKTKIQKRLSHCAGGLTVDLDKILDSTIKGLFKGVSTFQLDELLQETTAYMSTYHPDYGLLAGRLAATALHKRTECSFIKLVHSLYNYIHPITKEPAPLVSKDVYDTTIKYGEVIEKEIDYTKDMNFEYFGFMTLQRGYLLKMNNNVAERPQHMYMRVAIGIHSGNMEAALETYRLLSDGMFTHATPTLFNSGTNKPQLSSCFLIQMKSDSIEGIYDTLKTCAVISKYAGGIGVSVHNIRASTSYIKGTNGFSNGLVPMLRVFNETARYVDQGGGKRKGSFAIYLEPWHADIEDFLDLRKNTGKEEHRTRDLFLALWVCDLFMERVKEDQNWSLFCPDECKGLQDVWGADFVELYVKYEQQGKSKKVVKARTIWNKILESQIETGTPYMVYKDACNRKSNQQNLGTIKSSNLCTEIVEYTSPDEVAVCNLASICLPKYLLNGEFDHHGLFEITRVITKNLNRIIDICYYPVKEAEYSNKKHRPIGIGVQGLADLFFKLRIAFDSEEASKLNREIFETIYFAALTASKDLAKEFGSYESYEGSPVSKGVLQFDMWQVNPSDRWDWGGLKQEIKKHGIRNSLLLAPMPTASTSQIFGNNECIEPVTSNIYVRRVLSGEFPVINRYLVADLIKLGKWDPVMINRIIANSGSIQDIEDIPKELKNIYKTVWEIKQRTLIDMAADRGAFIDQSQSLNIFMAEPSISKLTSMHFYGWSKGLKTGMYYLRTKPSTKAIQFTVDVEQLKSKPKKKWTCIGEEGCLMCSS